jgi:methylated-DNA-protein-cysteine methyltransferase-like protein
MPRQVKRVTSAPEPGRAPDRSRPRRRATEADPESELETERNRPVLDQELAQRRWERIYDVVRRIPRGRVATYGQVASLAGLPRHARQVGYALHALPEETDVPWHRVVNARGEVSARSTPGWEKHQFALLRRERVIGRDGRVDLDRLQWEPGD